MDFRRDFLNLLQESKNWPQVYLQVAHSWQVIWRVQSQTIHPICVEMHSASLICVLHNDFA